MKEISPNELNSPEKPGDGWYIIEAAGQHPHGVRLHWKGGDVRGQPGGARQSFSACVMWRWKVFYANLDKM